MAPGKNPNVDTMGAPPPPLSNGASYALLAKESPVATLEEQSSVVDAQQQQQQPPRHNMHHVGAYQADENFEERLKAKMEAGEKHGAAVSDDTFHSRLHAKLKAGYKQDSGIMPPPASTPMSAHDKFEERLKAKMDAREKQGATVSDGTFDSRLHAKLKTGYKQDSGIMPPPAPIPMSADDKFEKRLKAKMEAGVKQDAVITSISDSGVDREAAEHKLLQSKTDTNSTLEAKPADPEGKIEVVNGKTQTSMTASKEFEVRLRKKLGVGEKRVALKEVSTEKSRGGIAANDCDVNARCGRHVMEDRKMPEDKGGKNVVEIHPESGLPRKSVMFADDAPRRNDSGGDDIILDVESGDDAEERSTRNVENAESFVQVMSRRFTSIFQGDTAVEALVTATLVEEVEGDVIVAERVGFFERKWKQFSVCSFVFGLVAIVLGLFFAGILTDEQSPELSTPPTLSPTNDLRPTLDIIQERGFVNCGIAEIGKGTLKDLCRAVAAVLLGDPDKNNGTVIPPGKSFQYLDDRKVDLLTMGKTHTIERELQEETTGVGFSFTTPVFYDEMVYAGSQTLVDCAEDRRRHDECSSLAICAVTGTTSFHAVSKRFPPDRIKLTSSIEESEVLFLNETCNVVAYDLTFLQKALENQTEFVFGDRPIATEPLALVTRKGDVEFSDIVNWVVQALFYGEERGLTQDMTSCHNYTKSMPRSVSELNFMNAVYCVGNYGELFGELRSAQDMNNINNGTTGMMYALPLGDLRKDAITIPDCSLLAKIPRKSSLDCGVVVPENFDGNFTGSYGVVGMAVEYCHTLAAALLDGHSEEVNITPFFEADENTYLALANGTIDVLAGPSNRRYDFETPTPFGGLHYSTPFFIGNETSNEGVSFYSIATRQDCDDFNGLFDSFVNGIITATIYAETKGITRENSEEMPILSIFGDLSWAMRDAIYYSGNYADIYSRNFGGRERGRNSLNDGGPMLLSFLPVDA